MKSKAALREELLARRRAAHPASAGEAAQSRLAALLIFSRARTVALYAALPGEVPTLALLDAAVAAGKRACFPRTPASGRRLSFWAATDLESFVRGPLGIREPGPTAAAVPLEEIDLFVVPGVGFGRDGSRLGHGAGYYDETLAAASPASRRVGLTFLTQVVDAVPITPTDIAMDWVVTETEVFRGLARP